MDQILIQLRLGCGMYEPVLANDHNPPVASEIVVELVSVYIDGDHGAVRLTVFENAPPGRHRMGIHSKESKC